MFFYSSFALKITDWPFWHFPTISTLLSDMSQSQEEPKKGQEANYKALVLHPHCRIRVSRVSKVDYQKKKWKQPTKQTKKNTRKSCVGGLSISSIGGRTAPATTTKYLALYNTTETQKCRQPVRKSFVATVAKEALLFSIHPWLTWLYQYLYEDSR